jgi:hypothetical protein
MPEKAGRFYSRADARQSLSRGSRAIVAIVERSKGCGKAEDADRLIDRTLILSPSRAEPNLSAGEIERVQEPVNVSAPLSVQVGDRRGAIGIEQCRPVRAREIESRVSREPRVRVRAQWPDAPIHNDGK